MTSRSELDLGAAAPQAAIAALVILVAALLTAVVRYRPDPAVQAVSAPTTRVLGEAHLPSPTAAALIDAIPWGRIERIETAGGTLRPLPVPRETPVLLELPAGEWRVALSNPSFEGELICDFTLIDGARHDCLVEFERLSVDQYFKDIGWWR